MKTPKLQYANSPEGKIAYQVVGDGPIDLVFVPPGRSHNLDVIWEHPPIERYLRRLGSFSRLILLNFRGIGVSDPIPLGAPPTIEEWMLDIRRVLDVVDSERAALMAVEVGGTWVQLFAATLPERTLALALVDCFAMLKRAENYPWGFPPDALMRFTEALTAGFGTPETVRAVSADLAGDERFAEWFARLERLSGSPSMYELLWRQTVGTDLRGILSSIKAPALVISHADSWVRTGHGRYLAEHIPDARYVERPGPWAEYWMSDVDGTLDEVQSFLTGTKGTPDLDNRVLATILFTDIVGSTQRAAEVGDERWRTVLDDHDALTRREIERFRGRLVKTTGDGILATFDGPARAIRCAAAVADAVRPLGVEVRTGLHTGEVELRGEDVGGIAVHIAARVMGEAGPGELLVSGSVPPLVAGSGIEFRDRGSYKLKGVPGEWRLYAVSS